MLIVEIEHLLEWVLALFFVDVRVAYDDISVDHKDQAERVVLL